jgi:hypothetical protein
MKKRLFHAKNEDHQFLKKLEPGSVVLMQLGGLVFGSGGAVVHGLAEAYGKCGPFVGFAFKVNGTVEDIDLGPYYIESQAFALGFEVEALIETEYLVAVLFQIEAAAIVAHDESCRGLGVEGGDLYAEPAVEGAVFDGVGDQVIEDAVEVAFDGVEEADGFVVEDHFGVGFCDLFLECGYGGLYGFAEAYPFFGL